MKIRVPETATCNQKHALAELFQLVRLSRHGLSHRDARCRQFPPCRQDGFEGQRSGQ